VNSVFNAGIIKQAGTYLMLNRVEDLSGSSCLWLARSDDGVHFRPDATPALLAAQDERFGPVERYGVEDPRLTMIEGRCYVTYVGYSAFDPLTLLAYTDDFVHFHRVAPITLPENKDVALFSERIGGRYVRLDRPLTQTSRRGDIWLSFSPDLVHWGDPHPVMAARPGKWDSYKIGAGTPPIRTDRGWLLIYHGVRMTSSGALYRLGAALLDLKEPWKVVGRANDAILSPGSPEDFMGNVGNVVFTCGALLEEDGELRVYYGAADQVMCLASAPIDDILALCLQEKP
jgi:predicted GH43/DUF377 family glycosyl hydrolase